MIDIHCHILPGIDDGPENVGEALKMARLAVNDGVQTIVATPHCYDGVYNCESKDILGRCEELNAVFVKERIALTVLPGAEVRLTPELPAMLEEGRAMTLADAGGFILLELPELFIPDAVVRTVRLLSKKGVRCIIAHPERNGQILAKNEILTHLIFAGAEIQLTAESLTGGFGRQVKLLSYQLLRLNGQCYLGSDGHDAKRRKPLLAKACKTAAKVVGREKALELVTIALNTRNQNWHKLAYN